MTERSRNSIEQIKELHPKQTLCFHCGLSTLNPLYFKDDLEKSFCCHGCLTVFQIIEESKLELYYEIKKDSDSTQFLPTPDSKKNFKHFDDESFKAEYVHLNNGEETLKLYLEGVHCIACLWLIENIPQIIKGVIKASFDFDNSVVTLSIKQGSLFSEVGKLLDQLGYPPHPIKTNDDAGKLKAKEERSFLIRLGIAMACMGNIFLFSISIYGGLEGNLKQVFTWLSFIISLPVVTYCSYPFYRSALAALRVKKLNMDLPISVALIAGTFSGLISIITSSGETYFDSLTSLVFLLLLSRYCLLKIRQNGVTNSNLEYFSSFGDVCVLKNLLKREKKFILAKYLQKNDLVLLKEGDIIPADGEIIEGSSFLNTSLLTGESLPIKAGVSSKVFSGSSVINGEFIMRVDSMGAKTKLGSILNSVKRSSFLKSPFHNLSERVSRYFIFVVFLLSFISIGYFWTLGTPAIGIKRALTLLIVTCPCALALASPLALTAAISHLLKKGIVLKNEEILERLGHAVNIYLDKTGTLTKGQFQVTSWKNLTEVDYTDLIWTLEKRASHPIATALRAFVENKKSKTELQLEEWIEVPGVGVNAKYKGDRYQIQRSLSYSSAGTSISLFKNQEEIVRIILKDSARDDSSQIIQDLKKLGLSPFIISGDSRTEVEDLAAHVGIALENTYSEVSPEGKLDILSKDQSSIMVGDGANDAMALSQASIGIAVKGSIDISLQAADVYFTKPGISSLKELILISRSAIKVIKINMIFSLIFNLFGTVLALSGIITPLMAAVLMPLSSLSVLLSTYFLSQEKG